MIVKSVLFKGGFEIDMFKELSEFIRLKLCIFASFLAIGSYLLFNQLSFDIIFVALVSFFVVMGGYAYNNIRDKEEDLINRKKENRFVVNKSYLIVVFSFLMALLLSLSLSFHSILFTIIGITVCTIYSLFRIKKYFLLKNIYTGFGVAQVFLLGANYITVEIFSHYLLISFFIIIGSIISDLRDYKGDKIVGIKTLPTMLGYDRSKEVTFLLLISYMLISSSYFPILLPFPLIMIYFLYKNNISTAHSCVGLSFVFLTFWLIVREVVNHVYGYI